MELKPVMMNCEEFRRLGLDMDRPGATQEEVAQATAHVQQCARCSALLASWLEVRADLRLLREATRLESAPVRVEMRLKQELRTRRETRVPRRTLAIASWALAAAAVVAGAVGWWHWREVRSAGPHNSPIAVESVSQLDAGSEFPVLLAAGYEDGSFTQLPGSLPSASSDQSILQVRMQRGALMQFGLPVEPERASELVNVDFLVGEDGSPIAVRLHQESQSGTISR